jgi:hypothetical protein
VLYELCIDMSSIDRYASNSTSWFCCIKPMSTYATIALSVI